MSPAAWSFLGTGIGAVIAGLVAWGVARLNRKPIQQSADVAGLTASNAEWKSLMEHYSTKFKEAEERLEAAEKRLDDVENDNRGLRTDIETMRHDEKRLLGYIARMHAGIAAGTIPPLDIPDWVLDYLNARGEHPA